MFFLHADAIDLPFKENVFNTIISLNLLHCLNDVKTVLSEIKRVLTVDGNSVLTTLIQSSRWSNRYLNMLAGSGALISRNSDDLLSLLYSHKKIRLARTTLASRKRRRSK